MILEMDARLAIAVNSLKQSYSLVLLCRRESNPVVSSSPVKTIILYCVYLAYCRPCGNWKFLAVHRVGFNDPLQVLC